MERDCCNTALLYYRLGEFSAPCGVQMWEEEAEWAGKGGWVQESEAVQ